MCYIRVFCNFVFSTCSVQLSMFVMERLSRNTLILMMMMMHIVVVVAIVADLLLLS